MNGKIVNEIMIENPKIYLKYRRTLNRIKENYLNNSYCIKMPICKWYLVNKLNIDENFDSKTCYCLELSNNNYWKNYLGQKKIIINNFNGEIPFSDLLQIADKWPYMCKRKGKYSMPLLAEEIISNLRPKEVYEKLLNGKNNIEQFYRRFGQIQLKINTNVCK